MVKGFEAHLKHSALAVMYVSVRSACERTRTSRWHCACRPGRPSRSCNGGESGARPCAVLHMSASRIDDVLQSCLSSWSSDSQGVARSGLSTCTTRRLGCRSCATASCMGSRVALLSSSSAIAGAAERAGAGKRGPQACLPRLKHGARAARASSRQDAVAACKAVVDMAMRAEVCVLRGGRPSEPSKCHAATAQRSHSTWSEIAPGGLTLYRFA